MSKAKVVMNLAASSNFQFAMMSPSSGRPRPATIQARTSVKGEFRCSLCDIAYKMREGQKAQCPLCEKDRQIEKLRDQIFELTNAQNMILNDLDRAKAEIDNLHAMKSALEAISSEDLAWVKQVLYRWQADRGRVAIRPAHGPRRKNSRGKAPVVGFTAIFRGSDDGESWMCNSVGGLALAGYLEEATALFGQIKAVEMLVRAVMTRMPGGVDE